MASKNKPSRLESEIEKCRSNANWNKILDLSKQFNSKSPGIGTLASFVQRESDLEKYLLEHPANESNVGKAREDLADIHRQFTDITIDPHVKPEMKQEAHILLSKICYAMGDYQAAYNKLEEVKLDTISLQNISIRKLQLLGEAYAIKGLCIEKIPPESTSKYKLAEREDSIIRCFEKSGDISLVQLQNRQAKGGEGSLSVALKAGGQWNVLDTESASLGPLVETAIQRSPILYIRNGELAKGIGRFRDLLCAVETRAFQSLRQTLARQLAEVLLRGVSRSTYQNVSPDSTRPTNGPRPKTYAGDGLFSPQDQCEETLLLLLISESIASREALLNRSGELLDERVRTLHSATAVYDLLAIALVRHAQYSLLSETFERALKFSFDEFHVWYQFALSMICAEKYTRAYLVLKECLRLEPRNAVVLLQAAKLCYEHLAMVEEGVTHCESALKLEENPMFARCHVYHGVGLALLEDECRLKQQRQQYQRQALHAFKRAVELDPHDFLAQFHLARQLAVCRQITDALRHVRLALRLQPEHVQAAHLLALLLSAQQQHAAALKLVSSTLEEYPDNFNLLLTRTRLEAHVHGVEQALHTCKHMLVLWRKVFEPMLDNEVRGTGLIQKISDDRRSLMQFHFSDYSDRDSNSLRAESMAASKIEQTLSEVASSLGSYLVVRHGPHQSWSIQTQIWLHLGEMYMSLGNMEAAHACISEASSIHPLSHSVSYMRGRLHEERGELAEARQCYENAVAINPLHANSLMHLGDVLQQQGSLRMAEKVLREGVNCAATCSGMWAALGRVLQALGEQDTAAHCHLTSVTLSNTQPVQPFSAIQLALQ